MMLTDLVHLILRIILILSILLYSRCQIRTKLAKQPVLTISNDLAGCCDVVDDSTSLFNCVNSSVMETNKRIFDGYYRYAGPNLAVGIVSFGTENIKNYTAFSYAVNAAYADHNNYILHLSDPATSNFDSYDSRWSKVKILEDALDPDSGWARDLDYVMWVDADLIFLDMGMRLEKIAAEYPTAHFFSSAEHAGSTTLINSGSVMVRNTDWARGFLSRWWNFANRTMFSDQEQFDMLYKQELDEDPSLRDKVIILQPDAINSDPPAMTQQKEHNQVLHLMGEQTNFRIKAFKSGFNEICRHIQTSSSSSRSSGKGSGVVDRPAPQLTVTQEHLHLWTTEVYAVESNKALEAYKLGSEEGIHSMMEARELSNAVHHYCHALEHPSRGVTGAVAQKQLALATKLRRSVYELLIQNLDAQRSNHLRIAIPGKYPYPRDWPEHVKTVATAGQHLLSTGTAQYRQQLAEDLMKLMDEMLSTSNSQQHDAIYHMIAHMYMQKGLIDLHQDLYDIASAYTNFKQSLDITEELAKKSGDHILVQPLTMCANALSQLERHREAFPMYLKAISVSEQHLGPTHESIGALLVNYGISLVQMNEFRKAVDVLERALHVMDINDPKQLRRDQVVYQRAKEFLEQANTGLSRKKQQKKSDLEF